MTEAAFAARHDEARFTERLLDDLSAGRIELPTLPEVALRVRDAVEGGDGGAAEIAAIVAQDPALAARLLQVANSPLYRGARPVEDLRTAITRMGLKRVRQLVVSLAMKQMFQATSDALDRAFRRIWSDSVEVASIARVLAEGIDGPAPEQAMLGGLIHQIGALPVLARLELDLGFETDSVTVHRLLRAAAPALGREILARWRFPEELVAVPVDCLELRRERARADVADLVLVARLEHLAATGRVDRDTCPEHWPGYSAFARVGVNTEITVLEMEGPAGQIAEVRAMLTA